MARAEKALVEPIDGPGYPFDVAEIVAAPYCEVGPVYGALMPVRVEVISDAGELWSPRIEFLRPLTPHARALLALPVE